MSNVQLSYVIATRNKLPFLKELLDDLLSSLEDDEEVIVVDSNSSDGTIEYVQECVTAGKVSYFVSETDYGESHGFNKAFLAAKGRFIKPLSDDDVFDLKTIRLLKVWLKEHPADLIFTPGFSNTVSGKIVKLDYRSQFNRWMKTAQPISFCGLGLIINRASLPYLGIFHTEFKRVDAEYSLRITALPKVNISYYSQPIWFRRQNPSSNSRKYAKYMWSEMIKLLIFYGGVSGLAEWLFERFLKQKVVKNTIGNSQSISIEFDNSIPNYQCCKKLLELTSAVNHEDVERNIVMDERSSRYFRQFCNG